MVSEHENERTSRREAVTSTTSKSRMLRTNAQQLDHTTSELAEPPLKQPVSGKAGAVQGIAKELCHI